MTFLTQSPNRAIAAAKRRLSPEERRLRNRAKRALHRQRHRARVNAKQAAYVKAHPEIMIQAAHRRRARKAQAPVCDFTPQQWKALKDAYDSCCAYCGRYFERLTQDHIIPFSKGGSHTLANIVPACRSCNARKGAKLLRPPAHQLRLMS